MAREQFTAPASAATATESEQVQAPQSSSVAQANQNAAARLHDVDQKLDDPNQMEQYVTLMLEDIRTMRPEGLRHVLNNVEENLKKPSLPTAARAHLTLLRGWVHFWLYKRHAGSLLGDGKAFGDDSVEALHIAPKDPPSTIAWARTMRSMHHQSLFDRARFQASVGSIDGHMKKLLPTLVDLKSDALAQLLCRELAHDVGDKNAEAGAVAALAALAEVSQSAIADAQRKLDDDLKETEELKKDEKKDQNGP
jgi:hypothetical protein